MTEQDNIELVERFYETVWNDRNLDAIKKIFDPEVEVATSAAMPDSLEGLAAIEAGVAMYHQGFSDANMTVEEIFADGPWVTAVWTGRGTHDGELAGMPPTGNEVEVSGVNVFRVEDGRIVENLGDFDGLGMMVQLGAMEPFEL